MLIPISRRNRPRSFSLAGSTAIFTLVVAAGLSACGGDDPATPSPTPQEPFDGGATNEGGNDGGVAEAATFDGPTPTWNDVYPVFARSCAPCHVGTGTDPKSGSGGHALASADKATAYKASQGTSYYCIGKKVGECALVRIKDGTMPQGGDCASTPKGAKCPSTTEQDLIQAWIAGGLREN